MLKSPLPGAPPKERFIVSWKRRNALVQCGQAIFIESGAGSWFENASMSIAQAISPLFHGIGNSGQGRPGQAAKPGPADGLFAAMVAAARIVSSGAAAGAADSGVSAAVRERR
jgi:hypothetical protein